MDILIENCLVQINGSTKYLFEIEDKSLKHKFTYALFRFMSKFPHIDYACSCMKLCAYYEGNDIRYKLTLNDYIH